MPESIKSLMPLFEEHKFYLDDFKKKRDAFTKAQQDFTEARDLLEKSTCILRQVTTRSMQDETFGYLIRDKAKGYFLVDFSPSHDKVRVLEVEIKEEKEEKGV